MLFWTRTHEGPDMNAQKSDYVRTEIWRAFMSKLSCVHVQTLVLSAEFLALMSRLLCVSVQTNVRSLVFADRVFLNARRLLCGCFGLDVSGFGLGKSHWFTREEVVGSEAPTKCQIKVKDVFTQKVKMTYSRFVILTKIPSSDAKRL